MKKIPKRRNANGKHNGADPDERLTPAQLCAYAKDFGVNITTNSLACRRRDRTGPPYLKVNGRWIQYPRRAADLFIEGLKPRLIDPAKRRGAA